MSEYWKSTPTYWCKFCSAYVRDTPQARQQHDATPRHQGNIKRSLRTLHNTQEREARDAKRAKDEVARLNGLVGSTNGDGDGAVAPTAKPAAAPSKEPARQATREDRKRQMQQLVDMGVAVPAEFRSEMAMAGEWKTSATRPMAGAVPRPDEIKVEPGAESIGVRKRKAADGDEDEDEDETETKPTEAVPKLAWGSRLKEYRPDEDFDIASLMGSASSTKVKKEPDKGDDGVKKEDMDEKPSVKREESADAGLANLPSADEAPTPKIVFKKRKKPKT